MSMQKDPRQNIHINISPAKISPNKTILDKNMLGHRYRYRPISNNTHRSLTPHQKLGWTESHIYRYTHVPYYTLVFVEEIVVREYFWSRMFCSGIFLWRTVLPGYFDADSIAGDFLTCNRKLGWTWLWVQLSDSYCGGNFIQDISSGRIFS